jgi:hypothetical protein
MRSKIPFWEQRWTVQYLCRVSEEEDWCIVGNHVPVTLVGTELDGEATRVASAIVRTGLATNRGEADSDGTLLAGLEEVGHAKVFKGIGRLVVSMGTSTLGVHDTFRDAFAVEV